MGAKSLDDCLISTQTPTTKGATSVHPTTPAAGSPVASTAISSAYGNISCKNEGPDQVGNYLCSGGKSVLNYFCASWRDDYQTAASSLDDKPNKFLAKCMSQDCQQSLAGNSQSYSNYCRFLDPNGFCYSYKEAQVWCANNVASPFCNSGGLDWAISPVGKAISLNNTKWTPKTQCSCLKNCACSATTCWCASEKDKKPVGQDSGSIDYAKLLSQKFGSNQISKMGMCTCSCNGVLGI